MRISPSSARKHKETVGERGGGGDCEAVKKLSSCVCLVPWERGVPLVARNALSRRLKHVDAEGAGRSPQREGDNVAGHRPENLGSANRGAGLIAVGG